MKMYLLHFCHSIEYSQACVLPKTISDLSISNNLSLKTCGTMSGRPEGPNQAANWPIGICCCSYEQIRVLMLSNIHKSCHLADVRVCTGALP